MVLDEYRGHADPLLTRIAGYFAQTHPDTMTWLAFAFALLAGITFFGTNFVGETGLVLLVLAAALIFSSATFDALDGVVARLRKMASVRGDFLDHVLDRYADVSIIGGISVSSFCDFRIGLLAILGVVFASYMGTQAQAVGIRRNYRGLLARADRLVMLIAAPIVQVAIENSKWIGWIQPDHRIHFELNGFAFPLSIIELMMIWFAIAGNVTAIQRAVTTWGDLKKKERADAKEGRGDDEEKLNNKKSDIEDEKTERKKK
jgi:archaetidylinositol phosphate synthase